MFLSVEITILVNNYVVAPSILREILKVRKSNGLKQTKINQSTFYLDPAGLTYRIAYKQLTLNPFLFTCFELKKKQF